jgi:hypothetical protein
MAAYYLVIEQGTTSQYAWPVLDDDGDPVTLTGYTATAQVRRSVDSADVLHEWSTTDDTILLQSNNVILVTPPATSLDWTWTKGVYDILITAPDGAVSRVGHGVVVVSRSVTRGA